MAVKMECVQQTNYRLDVLSVTVAHHWQEHIIPDYSLITFKFPDFSMFSRLVATLYTGKFHCCHSAASERSSNDITPFRQRN